MFPYPSPLLEQTPAAAGFGSHIYWRVYITDNWGDSTFVGIDEVVFLDGGGSPIAATGGTAIASGYYGTNAPSGAFDGGSNIWLVDTPTNQWVGYQFPTAKAVAGVQLKGMTGSAYLPRQPKNCTLQYSNDGTTWTTAFSFFGVNLMAATITYPETIPSGYHKFWRVFCKDNNGGSGHIALNDIQFRATSGGPDQSPVMTSNDGDATGRVLYSSYFGSNFPYEAFDSDLVGGGWWSSNQTNDWIGCLFPTAVKVVEIVVQAEGSGSTAYAPDNMTVDYSDDGATWTTQKTLAAQTSWGANEARVLAAV